MRELTDWPTRDPLAHRAATSPERTALVDTDSGATWTYRELDARVERRAGALASNGVAPDDRIGLLLSTRVAFVELVHAAMRLRATLVPLNAELTPEELGPQVQQAALDCLLCQAGTEETAVELADGIPVYSVDEPEHGRIDQVGRLDRPTAALGDRHPLERDRTALVLFTSGTTGTPKGVRLTVGNLLASATASAFRLGVRPDDRWLVCLPMYHMGGLAPVVRSTLYGTAVVLQPAFDAEQTGEVTSEHEITGVSLVPTMLVRMLDSGWAPPESLRFVLLGGAPAPQELIERCERRGVPVCPTYGATETASQIATALPEQAFEHPGTVGQPLMVTEVTILDDAGDPCEPGETGEIVVDGPTVTPGYLDAKASQEVFDEQGFYTGDVGYRDEDGRLWVLGRADDTILTGGENVHPEEVAPVIRDHPAVEDVAVVGLDDPEWGERIAALVVAGEVQSDALDAHCRDRLASFKIPKTWGVAAELPRTASGTVDREAVRERLHESGVGPESS